MLPVAVRRLDPDLPLPRYAHPGDAGLDLLARETTVIPAAGGRASVPTGLAVAIPEGYAGFVLPRSGLANRHGLTMVNTPGLIDSGYRGEIFLILLNTDPSADVTVERGERIGQLVVLATPAVELIEVDELPDTARGEGRFGSSGRHAT